jgi:hypothetical protein
VALTVGGSEGVNRWLHHPPTRFLENRAGMTKKVFSTFEQRVSWLLAHPHFLVGKLGEKAERPVKRDIVTAMKHDGLVSKKTYWPDVGLHEEIRQAKIRWFQSHNH